MFCGQANDVRPSYSMTFVLITTQTQSLLAVHQKHYSTRAVGTPELQYQGCWYSQATLKCERHEVGKGSPDPCAKRYMYVRGPGTCGHDQGALAQASNAICSTQTYLSTAAVGESIVAIAPLCPSFDVVYRKPLCQNTGQSGSHCSFVEGCI